MASLSRDDGPQQGLSQALPELKQDHQSIGVVSTSSLLQDRKTEVQAPDLGMLECFAGVGRDDFVPYKGLSGPQLDAYGALASAGLGDTETACAILEISRKSTNSVDTCPGVDLWQKLNNYVDYAVLEKGADESSNLRALEIIKPCFMNPNYNPVLKFHGTTVSNDYDSRDSRSFTPIVGEYQSRFYAGQIRESGDVDWNRDLLSDEMIHYESLENAKLDAEDYAQSIFSDSLIETSCGELTMDEYRELYTDDVLYEE